jgi:hypothetical protein
VEEKVFNDLTNHMFVGWESSVGTTMEKIFSGTMHGDKIHNGRSNYATLLDMFAEGGWSEPLPIKDPVAISTKAAFSYLIPLAMTQSDKVRPTLM